MGLVLKVGWFLVASMVVVFPSQAAADDERWLDIIRQEGINTAAEYEPDIVYLSSEGSNCFAPSIYGVQQWAGHGTDIIMQARLSACTLLETMMQSGVDQGEFVDARIVALNEAEAIQVLSVFAAQAGLENTNWVIELSDEIESTNPGIRYRLEVAAISPGSDERLSWQQ
ncbi:hypothetical protein [Hyphobacterium sp.]|uniref:hypothetical protein n=1 Tax=Hyphobacterium sp. TaxID=2004662 RepID=UPI0037488CC0